MLELVELEVHGIMVKIPYLAKLGHIAIKDGAEHYRPILPPYATLLGSSSGRPSSRQLAAAYKLIVQERYKELRRQAGCSNRTYKAPVVASAGQPAGTYSIDSNGCIKVNEAEFAERYVDTDGDRAFLIKDGQRALFIKFPIHMPVAMLDRADCLPEQWTDLRAEDIPKIQELDPRNWQAEFIAKHQAARVGQLTNHFDWFELAKASKYPTYGERLQCILSEPQRAEMIENPMKVARHSGTVQLNLPTTRLIPDPATAWRSGKNLPWEATKRTAFLDSDFVVEGMRSLGGMSFQRKPFRPGSYTRAEYPMLNPSGKGIVDRLRRIGVLQVREVPHADPMLPPVIMLSLRVKIKGKWHHASLTDCKRQGSKGMTNPLNYSFVVPPFIDVDEDGIKAKSALEVLEAELSAIDYNTSQGKWPVSYRQFSDWKVRISMVENTIRDFVARYGYASNDQAIKPTGEPGQHKNQMLTMKWQVASTTVTVRYPTTNPETMWHYAQEIQAWFAEHSCDFSPFGGDKQSMEPYRRYLVCPKGQFTPAWSSKYADPGRVSHIKSQLATAVPLHYIEYDQDGKVITNEAGRPKITQQKATVFVVGNSVHGQWQEQMFACPSGVAKQEMSSVLMRKFSNVPVDGATEVHYYSLTGEERVGWVSAGEESCIKAGKLITTYATKNQCAVFEEQLETVDGTEIDFVVPAFDWNKKKALPAMLQELPWRHATAVVNGQEVNGILIEQVQFYRTTNPGENKAPEFNWQHFTGMESHMIQKAVDEFEFPELNHTNDLTRANQLLDLIIDLRPLLTKHGIIL